MIEPPKTALADLPISIDEVRELSTGWNLATRYRPDQRIIREEQGFRVVGPGRTWPMMLLMTCLIVAGWSFFAYTAWLAKVETTVWALLIGIGVIAILSPLLVHNLHAKRLRRSAPLLEIDRATGLVSLHAASKTFPHEDVIGLLSVEILDADGSHSELQLLLAGERSTEAAFIASADSSFPRNAFRKVLSTFVEDTGLPAWIVSGRGKMRKVQRFQN